MRLNCSRGIGIRLAGLTLIAALGGALRSQASDWARWRGPEGTGISSEKGWKPQALAAGKIKWKASLGKGHSCLSVAGNRLYTMGNPGGSDIVYCLDSETGKEIWKHSYPCDQGNFEGPRSTPVVDGDCVYSLSREGHAFCLEAATGKVKWQKNLIKDFGAANITWGFASSPVIVDKAVVYNARASGLALDKLTGEKIWESGGGQSGYASAVRFSLKGKDSLAFFSFKDVIVVDALTGEKQMSHPWQTQYDVNAADPVFFDGKLFITSGYEHGCTLLDLSGKNVKQVWENQNLRGHFASPIYLDGHLYGVDGNTGQGQLRCLEAKSGKVKWTHKGGFENLMIASGMILAIDKNGTLVTGDANPNVFKEAAKATVLNAKAKNWTAPVLANGFIYCRNSDGDLVCVDVH
ncbi:MAG TPA: PQQ-binding-like beta-propeller repeat protein [Planctomycetota bacterium]|nr:PQQ-binding-like beta-propeller repeat protein [Planctomycetota bacterium]